MSPSSYEVNFLYIEYIVSIIRYRDYYAMTNTTIQYSDSLIFLSFFKLYPKINLNTSSVTSVLIFMYAHSGNTSGGFMGI